MKHISTALLLTLTIMSMPILADTVNDSPSSATTIDLQLQAQQWVTAKTAKVTVQVNAALNENELGSVYSDIQQKLDKLAPQAEWHITQFTRSEDNTGLENVTVLAEARLSQTALSNLRAQAKAISQPGETYSISDMAFSPSFAEIQTAKAELRSQIYQQALNEVTQLNKIFNEQFKVRQITFMDMWGGGPQPLMNVRSNALIAVPAGKSENNNSLSVGQEVTITANVKFAAQ